METKLLTAKKTDVTITEHNEIITEKGSLKLTKSPKTTKSDLETTESDEYLENHVSSQELVIFETETEFTKIPTEQDLQFLDSISLYECKIQTILLLQKVLPHYVLIGQKINEKNQDDTFLGIEIDLLIKVLGER